jgi:hypothetical protein
VTKLATAMSVVVHRHCNTMGTSPFGNCLPNHASTPIYIHRLMNKDYCSLSIPLFILFSTRYHTRQNPLSKETRTQRKKIREKSLPETKKGISTIPFTSLTFTILSTLLHSLPEVYQTPRRQWIFRNRHNHFLFATSLLLVCVIPSQPAPHRLYLEKRVLISDFQSRQLRDLNR